LDRTANTVIPMSNCPVNRVRTMTINRSRRVNRPTEQERPNPSGEQADRAGKAQPFRSGPGITDDDRAQQRQSRQYHQAVMVPEACPVDEAQQDRCVGVPVQKRIQEGAEPAFQTGRPGQRSVQGVERAGEEKEPCAQGDMTAGDGDSRRPGHCQTGDRKGVGPKVGGFQQTGHRIQEPSGVGLGPLGEGPARVGAFSMGMFSGALQGSFPFNLPVGRLFRYQSSRSPAMNSSIMVYAVSSLNCRGGCFMK